MQMPVVPAFDSVDLTLKQFDKLVHGWPRFPNLPWLRTRSEQLGIFNGRVMGSPFTPNANLSVMNKTCPIFHFTWLFIPLGINSAISSGRSLTRFNVCARTNSKCSNRYAFMQPTPSHFYPASALTECTPYADKEIILFSLRFIKMDESRAGLYHPWIYWFFRGYPLEYRK